ncbi:stage II sporulation protein M [Actinopolymorpha pittospori]|uniref:Membrane protein SpoIIM required for sporulation n=1 Tax=Actinopolymorpha pittospori TaxID=648752 RepID=A0A927RK30_9ACTN|nr:putative membrane protein SpoIIM required for sporulation [Actinopolymorpha pittospori]
MDLDAYAAAHQAEWDRLEVLVGRRGRLGGAEADELVTLYQRVATHLSVVRSTAPDAVLVGRLSTLVARARSAVTGAHTPAWRDVTRFFTVSFPAALYRCAPWWLTTAVVFFAVCWGIGWWVATHPEVQAALVPPAAVQQLVDHDFADYYSSAPAAEFAFGVWTNNAWIAAGSLALGVFLGAPVLYVLFQNAANVGLTGGLMVANDRADVFFGLIMPHGLLEITAVLVAGGAGLRLGWTVVSPGPRTRLRALAETGRETVGMALGLAVVLLVSGVIEAFVTPSGLPTWSRIGIGVLAEVAFLSYALLLGGRMARAGETGDMALEDRGDLVPTSA